MSWMTIEGEELVRLKRRVNETGMEDKLSYRCDGRRVLLCKRLVCCTLRASPAPPARSKADDGTLFPLDGSSAQIYDANEAAGLRLTSTMSSITRFSFAAFFAPRTETRFASSLSAATGGSIRG